MKIELGGGREIGFERKGKEGIVKIKRKEEINEMKNNMIMEIDRELKEWEDEKEVDCVIIEGEGRDLWEGGDVVEELKEGKEGKKEYELFNEEYRINERIGSFKKKYV